MSAVPTLNKKPPYDPVRDTVMLVEQFRFGPHARGDARSWSLEPIAGRIDPFETPEVAVRREAAEEARLSLHALHRIGRYYVSPGAVTEYLITYVGIANLPASAEGVSGLKVFKQFGLEYKNPDGSLIKIDDPRWDPIWQACGDAGIPVIIHTSDPAAFFEPIDAKNERYEELMRHPDWSFYGDQFPSRMELLNARNNVIARHPNTQFIGAHIANHAEDLSVVAKWLDEYPNLWIEPASRISELGRQPFTAREFLVRYANRLLFGTDGPWPEQRLRLYWQFFETHDEYIAYSEKSPPPQGFWNIYGVDLPDDVLRKMYYENASKLIPGVAERLKKRE